MFKVGDKVRRIEDSIRPESCGYAGDIFTVSGVHTDVISFKEIPGYRGSVKLFELVEESPKRWGDLSDREKGALLLADHKGKTIQLLNMDAEWVDLSFVNWFGDKIYRVKPEPVVETITLYTSSKHNYEAFSVNYGDDTHKIIFDVVDGKPNCSSVRMEEL